MGRYARRHIFCELCGALALGSYPTSRWYKLKKIPINDREEKYCQVCWNVLSKQILWSKTKNENNLIKAYNFVLKIRAMDING